MDISIIIPAHNEEDYIGGCLDSIREHAPGKFREVIVVDNASTDKTADVARAHGARVVYESRKGLTHARQAGLEASQSEFLAYTDADCKLTPEWFATVEKYFARYPDAVSLSGPVKYFDGPILLRALIVALEWLTLPISYATAGYLIIGGNFVARRKSLIEIGGFDREIAFYGEDADIARRLSRDGRTIFRMDFYTYTSTRRWMQDGIMRTSLRYAMNFVWHVLFHRPFTTVYTDVRT